MVMFVQDPQRTELYQRFARPTPRWFSKAGLGIFVHWGAYSVPAWAEPIGTPGAVEDREYWFAHNPYAEWYFNTIRIEGSPAQQYQTKNFDGAPYDSFLDMWKAEAFDPTGMIDLFARAGARYVIPTTKHHDGVTLWDAPGTGNRNAVRRGPRRDIVGELAQATRDAGLRFGVYYSTGLDWHAAPTPPIMDDQRSFVEGLCLPQDEEYARYVFAHLNDLIEKYGPDVLWGDLEYPKAGEGDSSYSLRHVLERFYNANPEGVINDRFGTTHWDFRTAEYEHGNDTKGDDMWELTRGIGYSFGYNQLEGAETYMNASQAIALLADVVSRGGNLLLNVGPDAAGRIPDLQRQCLEGIAAWNDVNGQAVHDVEEVPFAVPADNPWVRWTANDDSIFALVDGPGTHHLKITTDRIAVQDVQLLDGRRILAKTNETGVTVELPAKSMAGPQVLRFQRR